MNATKTLPPGECNNSLMVLNTKYPITSKTNAGLKISEAAGVIYSS